MLFHGDLEEAQWFLRGMLVTNDPRFAFPVYLPDRIQLTHTVGGFMASDPAESTGLMPPAVVGMSEGGRGLHPHDDLVQQKVVTLESGCNSGLLYMSVPYVNG
jgi:hypothetical protein